jgi:hypothetical protein
LKAINKLHELMAAQLQKFMQGQAQQ